MTNLSRSISNSTVLCMMCTGLTLYFTGQLNAGLFLDLTPTTEYPSLHSIGVQFDPTTAFVGRPSSGAFFVSDNSGRSWMRLTVRTEHKTLPDNNYAIVKYFNKGCGVIFANNASYYTTNSGQLISCSCIGLSMRGQDGFRIDKSAGNSGTKHLMRTFDGGIKWVSDTTSRIWFDQIESFDPLENNTVFALVYITNSHKRGDHHLAVRRNFARKWQDLGDLGKSPGIWPTHLFFVNDKNGWISSDRDDGLFVTSDGGSSWRKVATPERIVSGIFFKDVKHGRIIGGIELGVYETNDGGTNWKSLSGAEIASDSFTNFFQPTTISRWNDFAVLQTLVRAKNSISNPLRR